MVAVSLWSMPLCGSDRHLLLRKITFFRCAALQPLVLIFAMPVFLFNVEIPVAAFLSLPMGQFFPHYWNGCAYYHCRLPSLKPTRDASNSRLTLSPHVSDEQIKDLQRNIGRLYDCTRLFRLIFPDPSTHPLLHHCEICLFLLCERWYVKFIQGLMAWIPVDSPHRDLPQPRQQRHHRQPHHAFRRYLLLHTPPHLRNLVARRFIAGVGPLQYNSRGMAEVVHLCTYHPQGSASVHQSPHILSGSHCLWPQSSAMMIARLPRFLRADLGPSTIRNISWHLLTKQGR